MTVQHCANCMSQREVDEWVERLKEKLTSFVDNSRFGLRWLFVCIEAKEHVDRCIRNKRIFRIDDISSDMVIGLGRKRFKNSLRCNWKYFVLMESWNLWTAGQNALKYGN